VSTLVIGVEEYSSDPQLHRLAERILHDVGLSVHTHSIVEIELVDEATAIVTTFVRDPTTRARIVVLLHDCDCACCKSTVRMRRRYHLGDQR
jgi:hypothetical protein